MNPVELERRLQRIERALEDLASAGRPRLRPGSWTPDMYGSTTYGSTTYPDPNLRTGYFLVLDQICFFSVEVYWTSTTASGVMRFTLPLATASGRPRAVFALRHTLIPYTSGDLMYAMASAGVTYFNLFRAMPDGTDAALNVTSTGYVAASGLYWIA